MTFIVKEGTWLVHPKKTVRKNKERVGNATRNVFCSFLFFRFFYRRWWKREINNKTENDRMDKTASDIIRCSVSLARLFDLLYTGFIFIFNFLYCFSSSCINFGFIISKIAFHYLNFYKFYKFVRIFFYDIYNFTCLCLKNVLSVIINLKLKSHVYHVCCLFSACLLVWSCLLRLCAFC